MIVLGNLHLVLGIVLEDRRLLSCQIIDSLGCPWSRDEAFLRKACYVEGVQLGAKFPNPGTKAPTVHPVQQQFGTLQSKFRKLSGLIVLPWTSPGFITAILRTNGSRSSGGITFPKEGGKVKRSFSVMHEACSRWII